MIQYFNEEFSHDNGDKIILEVVATNASIIRRLLYLEVAGLTFKEVF